MFNNQQTGSFQQWMGKGMSKGSHKGSQKGFKAPSSADQGYLSPGLVRRGHTVFAPGFEPPQKYRKGGKGKGKASEKPEKKPERAVNAAIFPLEESTLLQVKALVQAESGSISLGKICHSIHGVKKLQLDGLFQLEQAGDQWLVSLKDEDLGIDFTIYLPNGIVEAVVDASGQPLVAPLDDEKILRLTELLTNHGGILPMGVVAQYLPGVKVAQLKGHFEVEQIGTHGQYEVRLLGMKSRGATMMFDGQAVPIDAPLPDLTEEQIVFITNAILASEEQSVNVWEIEKKVCPGVKRKQLEPHFDVRKVDKKRFFVFIKTEEKASASQRERKRPMALKPTDQVPLSRDGSQEPPLTQEQVDKITDYLLKSGGSNSVGRVTGHIKGIKRTQLEGVFAMQQHGQFWVVGIDEIDAANPPPAILPKPSHKFLDTEKDS
eukprot:TRINITY_DN6573_c0_g1_i1.p1 TRINITY_DN6573_c0_g1~~TRINITY_DN6573_c0_g1_i1.p1  ORF type:complete len:459 (+),score=70.84 TRINITY_DN6573_c0_g1_i1:80-1378(+)